MIRLRGESTAGAIPTSGRVISDEVMSIETRKTLIQKSERDS